MRVQISGKHIEIGDALPAHVEARLDEVVGKYSQRPVEANVTFSKDGFEFVCDASAHLSSGLTAQAKGRAGEIYEAFEAAAARMEKQLRRHKRKLKNHHNTRTTPIEAFDAPSYILSASEEDDSASDDRFEPVVVAEMETQIKALSVGEAVMEMELRDAPILVFRNLSNNNVNVIYARDDGNIGWIDPQNMS